MCPISHWYNAAGQLFAEVPNKSKPGQMRDFTLRDARAHPETLYPSITTVMGVIEKPGLRDWQIEEAIRTALQYGGDDVKFLASKADEKRRYAADYGTAIHNEICAQLGGSRSNRNLSFMLAPAIAQRVVQWLHYEGYEILATEETIVNIVLGLAGTIDLRAMWKGKRVIVDFKSRDFTAGETVQPYKEHGYQVAGYDQILGGWAEERHILYISRTDLLADPQRVICGDPERDDRIMLGLWDLWKLINKYGEVDG